MAPQHTDEIARKCRLTEIWQKIQAAVAPESTLAVIHKYEHPEEMFSSDVDCFLPSRLVPDHLVNLLKDADLVLVNSFHYEENAYCFVVAEPLSEQRPTFLRLDVAPEFRHSPSLWAGSRLFLDEGDMTDGLVACEPVAHLSPELEFTYYLLKKVVKRDLATVHGARLSDLFSLAPGECTNWLVRFWPRKWVAVITQAATTEDWTSVIQNVDSLRRSLLVRSARAHPFQVLVGSWRNGVRLVGRAASTAGLHVALLGPDGAGKTTVANALIGQVGPAFNGQELSHLRPGLFRRDSGTAGPVSAPHALPPRGWLPSMLKTFDWTVDYTLGYWLKIWPKKAKGHLIVYDRYAVDTLVDPRRYRYGGPAALVKLMCWLAPKPDIVVALDVPEHVLQARKSEVPYAETERQRRAYRQMVDSLPNGYVVDGHRHLDHVVADVRRIMLREMEERTNAKFTKSPSYGEHTS